MHDLARLERGGFRVSQIHRPERLDTPPNTLTEPDGVRQIAAQQTVSEHTVLKIRPVPRAALANADKTHTVTVSLPLGPGGLVLLNLEEEQQRYGLPTTLTVIIFQTTVPHKAHGKKRHCLTTHIEAHVQRISSLRSRQSHRSVVSVEAEQH